MMNWKATPLNVYAYVAKKASLFDTQMSLGAQPQYPSVAIVPAKLET
jgi:hypothetical protein